MRGCVGWSCVLGRRGARLPPKAGRPRKLPMQLIGRINRGWPLDRQVDLEQRRQNKRWIHVTAPADLDPGRGCVLGLGCE